MAGTVQLSVIIPAFNEAARLESSLSTLPDCLPSDTELIVVDDGSSDGTAEVAAECLRAVRGSIVLRLEHNRGKGAAVRYGVERAGGRNLVYMDADLATDPRDLPSLLEGLADCDIALGSRAAVGAIVDCKSHRRVVMGRTFNRLVRLTSGLPLRDTQCGFKAFRAPVGKALFGLSRIEGYAFDVEILLLARLLGLRIAEVPVRWRHVEGSKIRVVHDPMAMAADVLRTRLLWRTRLDAGRSVLEARNEDEGELGSGLWPADLANWD